MPTYTAHFYTEADWAETEIEAATPELALQRAHQIESEETETLAFQSYDSTGGIEHIEIMDPSGDPAIEWRHPDLMLRLAAHDLLETLDAQTEAAQGVLDAWCSGDLAGAVRNLDEMVTVARTAIAKAKGGAQ